LNRNKTTALSFDMCNKNVNHLDLIKSKTAEGVPGYQRGIEKFMGKPDFSKSS